MSTANGVNVAKFEAGGGGDNVVADGYIKAVEKVWLDSYTIAFTDTNCTLDIAVLPKNKKITSVEVVVETTASQTSGTLSVGFNSDSGVDSLVGATAVTHNQTLSSVSLYRGVGPAKTQVGVGKAAGFQKVTGGTQTTVALKLNNWTMTTGTVKSIVRYT